MPPPRACLPASVPATRNTPSQGASDERVYPAITVMPETQTLRRIKYDDTSLNIDETTESQSTGLRTPVTGPHISHRLVLELQSVTGEKKTLTGVLSTYVPSLENTTGI